MVSGLERQHDALCTTIRSHGVSAIARSANRCASALLAGVKAA